ncbi:MULTISPECIES: hypothetical protein [unclassified Nonomuraea]|uniref:hypothetical protein n=1 Tax=unclassified Nonomuraea TaxID=2593643 RepID=UPI0033DA9A62
MTVRDLRDVLREHGDATPPSNPARHEQVRARISRIRLRRRLAAAGTAVATLAALAFVFLPGMAGAGPDTTAATSATAGPLAGSPVPDELPETFTAPDGTVYRRLATASIGTTGSRKATVTVPVTGKPLDLAGLCTPKGRRLSGIQIGVNGRPVPSGLLCKGSRQLAGLTVPRGTGKRATITFDTTTHGSGCVRADSKSPCRPLKEERSPWSLAVYEWTPPKTPVEPGAPRAFPPHQSGWKLADTRTGTWPAQRSVTFRVRGDGRQLGVDQICTGDLATRLWFRYEIDGKDTGAASACGVWEKGPFPMGMSLFKTTKGKPVTVTLKLFMESPTGGRPVRWSVGLFRQ